MSTTTNTNSTGLSPKQLQVIQALATGAAVADAATAANIHRSTIHNWCTNLPHFRAALRNAKTIHAEAIQDGLRALSHSALSTLRAVLENESTPPAVRLRAALAVIKSVEAQHQAPQPNERDRALDEAAFERVEIRPDSTEFDAQENFRVAAA